MKIFIATCWIMLTSWWSSFNCSAQNIDVHSVSMQTLQSEAKMFYAKNDKDRFYFTFEKVENLKTKGLFADALDNLKRLDYENLDDATQEKILSQAMFCSILADKKNDAIYFLTQYKNYVKDSTLNKKAAYLFPLVYLQNEDWENAYKSMLLQSDSITGRKIDSIWQVNFPTFRNPKTATILSAILPGSGQCYAGKVGFGLINLLGIAGSGYFLAWHFVHHYYAIGTITGGGLFSRFYLGGLKTSRNFVEKNNYKKAFIFKQKMSSYWMNCFPNRKSTNLK